MGPCKRCYHTIIPGMATYVDTGELFACFGNMGGFMQPQGHVQVIIGSLKDNLSGKFRFFHSSYITMNTGTIIEVCDF